MSAELAETFAEAQQRVKTLTSAPPNETLLELYALYKQGTGGDVSGKRPSMIDFRGRAKFDAWATKRGTSTEDAQRAYVALVDELVGG